MAAPSTPAGDDGPHAVKAADAAAPAAIGHRPVVGHRSNRASPMKIVPPATDTRPLAGRGSAILQSGRVADKPVEVAADLPCNVIVVHGVNDVGTSYRQVEEGLCAGLNDRLRTPGRFKPGAYRLPTRDDRHEVVDDPDAVFFKRHAATGDRTPVIPFYWGFREADDRYRLGRDSFHGQNTDFYGNRLDKDFSKGGGPFMNATTTLPDMWGPGEPGLGGILNSAVSDPLRPLLGSPGRMYMILAAERLAALVAMMRRRHPDDVVNIVAHSQGCMLSLLAQAFLMERDLRPADTLVLTHPPYSLVDDVPWTSDAVKRFKGGEDDRMKGRYASLEGGQTLHARLTTLARIVQGVAAQRHAKPQLAELKDSKHRGMVGARWAADAPERDNRGKVYLYFCPEDTTVALENVQGIGWQGVPDVQQGRRRTPAGRLADVVRRPLDELGTGFFQRVFTGRKRPHPSTGQPVLVGQAPHDFALRVAGETGFEHVAKQPARRAELPQPPVDDRTPDAGRPDGARERARQAAVRRISGEPLAQPVAADMSAGAEPASQWPEELRGAPAGAYQEIDPIDASTGSTQQSSYRSFWHVIDDRPAGAAGQPVPDRRDEHAAVVPSPASAKYPGPVRLARHRRTDVLDRMNAEKPPNQRCPALHQVYVCLDATPARKPTGQLLVHRVETPDEYRLRCQNELAERSFHSAIFGSADNHKNVTAYDIAIGGGRASSDPVLYEYLCAVADWRLTVDDASRRETTPKYSKFLFDHGKLFDAEAGWCQALITGNASYYTTGILPSCLTLLAAGTLSSMIVEPMA